jgi:membrane protein YqaA with SNARE-associated domain
MVFLSQMRLSDKIFLGSVAVLLVYWVIILVVPGFLGPLQLMYSWLVDLTLLIGYPGAFVVSFLGCATILLPFPYVGVPFILGGLRNLALDVFAFNPWIVGLVAGVGATLGEMISYLIGYGGGALINEDQKSGFRDFVQKHRIKRVGSATLFRNTPEPLHWSSGSLRSLPFPMMSYLFL